MIALLGVGPGHPSTAKQRFQVATPMYHAGNRRLPSFDAVDDRVLTRSETPRLEAEVFVAAYWRDSLVVTLASMRQMALQLTTSW